MSALLARVMLAVFMLPCAAVLYVIVFVTQRDTRWLRDLFGYRSQSRAPWILAGLMAWAFIGIYWWLIWRKQIRWTSRRLLLTTVATIAAVGLGLLTFWVLRLSMSYDREFSTWAGTVVAPLAWLIGTTLAWRETATERVERTASGSAALACPTCGYNLTGLRGTRCPECGTEFTLNELLASQNADRNDVLA